MLCRARTQQALRKRSAISPSFFPEISPKHDRNFLLPVFQIAAVRVSQTDISCIYLNHPPIAQSETASSRANYECSQHVFAAGQEIRSYMYLYVCLYPRVPRTVESAPFSWYRIARLRGWVSSERHSWVQRLPHQVRRSLRSHAVGCFPTKHKMCPCMHLALCQPGD